MFYSGNDDYRKIARMMPKIDSEVLYALYTGITPEFMQFHDQNITDIRTFGIHSTCPPPIPEMDVLLSPYMPL